MDTQYAVHIETAYARGIMPSNFYRSLCSHRHMRKIYL